MFTRRFRGSVLQYPTTIPSLTFWQDQKPIPDLARGQVYQFGDFECSITPNFENHYQVAVFSDVTLPADATFLFEASGACSITTTDEHWDSCVSADSNLVVDNSAFLTMWFVTQANKGGYNGTTNPEGLRQNLRVIRTVDASTGSINGETVLSDDIYGGAWIKSNNVVNPNGQFVVSTPGVSHAFLCLWAGIDAEDWFDTTGPGPSLLTKRNARVIKVGLTAGLGTEVSFGVQTIIDCAAVDPLTGDLWVAYHDSSETSSTTSNWKLDQYDSNLNLISSTALTNFLTTMAFSNFGGTPIIYCEQNGTTGTTLRRFDVNTLSFLSNVTISNFGTVHPGHGALAVDSTAGYLYRTSARSSTNALSCYRLTDFTLLGPCTTTRYGWANYLCGPVLTSDNGKLYANGEVTTGTPPSPPGRKKLTGCWVAPFYDQKDTYPTAYQGEITNIEEDWEYQLDVPYDNQGSPVVRQRLMCTSGCSAFQVSTLRIGPFGGNLELFQSSPNTNLTLNTTSQNTPSITNELITWTSKLELSGTNFVFTVPSASSITVPDLTSLTLSTTPNLKYIGDFDPSWSINGFISTTQIPGTNRNGTEIFFDRCNFGITHLKRTAYRINFSNSVTITGGPDTVTNPWPTCTPLDPSFVTSFFTGISCTAVHVDQADKIGYFILQDAPNLINKVDLPNRVVTDTITTSTRIIPYTDGYGYFDETNQQLYFTGVEQDITSTTLTQNALAFNSSNVAYTIQRSGGTSYLYTINVNTGAATLVGNTGIANLAAVEFDTDGTLYAMSGASATTSTLYTLNPATGAVLTTVGSTGLTEVVAIAIRKSDGVLFGWKSGASPGLYTISKSTATPTAIGGINTQMADMTFHPTTHVLYGVTGFNPGSEIFSIDTATGGLTTVVSSSIVPQTGTYGLAWDNQGTPKLWLKWSQSPSFINEVDVSGGTITFGEGPLLIMVDTNLLTYTKGDPAPNFDGIEACVFDTTAGFGYCGTTNSSGNEKIYKYNLNTLSIVDTLTTNDARSIFAGAIDPTGGFAYFVHSDGFTNPLLIKVSLSSFTISASLTLTGTTTTVRTAAFMNSYLYVIDELGFAMKIDSNMSVDSTLQLPKTPAQTAYIYSFPQTVPVRGQVGLNPFDNLIYVGINSTIASSIYKIDAVTFTVIGSLPLDSYFKGFHSVRSVGLTFDPKGYGAPNTPEGNVIEFDFSGGDPHFVSLRGEKFSFHGEPNKIYNLYTDENIQINSQFRYWETSHQDNFTAMQEIGIKFRDLRIKISATDQTITINNMNVENDLPFLRFLDKLPEKYESAKKNEGFGEFINGILIRIYNYEFLVMFSTDHVNPIYLNLITNIDDEVDAHGVIGQTAMYHGEPRISTGRNGEGIVEGCYKDYEVSDLFADDFKFNKWHN